MLRSAFGRFLVPFSFIFLFVFAQIGASTHAVSHVHAPTEQTHQDHDSGNIPAEQCELCIAFASAANGVNQTHFVIPSTKTVFTFLTAQQSQTKTQCGLPLGARAPPTTFIS